MGTRARASSVSKIEAELLAIDGFYQTADDIDAALRGKPAQAWLQGEYHANYSTELTSKGDIQMAKVLVVTSGKGGVGKTTTTAALGAALAQRGDRRSSSSISTSACATSTS